MDNKLFVAEPICRLAKEAPRAETPKRDRAAIRGPDRVGRRRTWSGRDAPCQAANRVQHPQIRAPVLLEDDLLAVGGEPEHECVQWFTECCGEPTRPIEPVELREPSSPTVCEGSIAGYRNQEPRVVALRCQHVRLSDRFQSAD